MIVQTESFFGCFLSAWPALTSSHLSLLLLANTLDSAAELALHNPDCRTLRKKKHIFSQMLDSVISLDGYFYLLIKNVFELHHTGNHWQTALLEMATPALPMAPAGFFLFLLWDYSSLHILCGASLLWNLLLSTSFTASSTPTLKPPQVKVKHPLWSLSNAAALVGSSMFPHQ